MTKFKHILLAVAAILAGTTEVYAHAGPDDPTLARVTCQ
jgi:hypothetical protein